MEKSVFKAKCQSALQHYSQDIVCGDDERVEACWYLIHQIKGSLELGERTKRPRKRVVFIDLQKLGEEVVSLITGRTGNAPEMYIALCNTAIHIILDNDNQLDDGEVITTRLKGVPIAKMTGQLRAHDINSVIAVKGTIVRLSSVQPLASTMVFSCGKCAGSQTCRTVDGVVKSPQNCTNKTCRSMTPGRGRFGGGGGMFYPQPRHPETRTTNFQRLRLQVETQSVGRIPCSVEVELRGALCDTANPGDVITCTGILKQDPGNRRTSSRAKDDRGTNLSAPYLECNNLTKSDAASSSSQPDTVITAANMKGIEMLSKRKDIFMLLVHSLCPGILGHDIVKAGMILTLFGGTPRNPELGQRGDTHLLVVGDPGAGKSQMLKAISHVSPRGVCVSGNSSSASGLTVTLVRDAATGDSALEAGALVLGDQGTTCIDEFDKMEKTEHQALLEAMEQQRISIAKAGAVGSLPARTSVIAAANPTSGHYDDFKSVAENVKINPALLSRFDLVFILKDTIAGAQQEGLTRHVINMHSGGGVLQTQHHHVQQQHSTSNMSQFTTQPSAVENRLLDYRRRYTPNDYIPHKLITKYITHAKRTVRPRLSPGASDLLLEYYLSLRKISDKKNAMLITTRQLESLIRLAQSRAKVELREVVTETDASDVIDLMKRSLYQLCTDVETGQIDADRGPCGSGRSKDGRELIRWMVSESSNDPSRVFTHKELVLKLRLWGYTEIKAEKTLTHLNSMGDMLSTSGGYRARNASTIQTPAKRNGG
eukprot:TRINITY_DN8922_c0_g2_i1.p1 TRINITY_DN8922_c0_g2~~TRINITY_DN8922_c0_g2_i1.p1  ORF type:complete len:767 (+),score=122.68 TRINITY_DN8922_c0_g2_i1:40-2340(+)